MTASAAPRWPRGRACAAWASGWRWSAARSRSNPRRGRGPRCAPGARCASGFDPHRRRVAGARGYRRLVRFLLNLIWLVFGGLWLALGYAVVALVMFILIITIPFGIASARIALFCLWPFGRTLVRRPGAGAGSLIGNVIWIILAGWWLALGHLVSGVAMCLTIVGIPLGLANFKLIPVSLTPFGRDIVDIEQARRLGWAVDAAMSVKPRRP